jgi:hypothetical protein
MHLAELVRLLAELTVIGERDTPAGLSRMNA